MEEISGEYSETDATVEVLDSKVTAVRVIRQRIKEKGLRCL